MPAQAMAYALATCGWGHATDATDATNVFRGVLLRRVLYKYLRQIFPKLEKVLEPYGKWAWFHQTFKVTSDEDGAFAGGIAGALGR